MSLDTTVTAPDPPAESPLRVGRNARIVLAALSAGAGVIHLALVPSHWGTSVAEGLGFALVGWFQLIFAAWVLVRPGRPLLAAGVIVNVAALVAWSVSRTLGLPFGDHAGHAENFGFVDGVCVAFEAVLAIAAAGLWAQSRTAPSQGSGPGAGDRRSLLPAALTGAAVIVLTTAALASPSARNHSDASHGDHGTEAATAVAAHDHATAHGTSAAGAPADDRGLSSLHNGQHDDMTMLHSLDPATQAELDRQLAITREVAALTPTVADAEAAGYRQVGPYFPGIGAHYWKPLMGAAGFTGGASMNPDGVVDDDDLRNPLMLVFEGTEPTSRIAGFMYYSFSRTEPAGFAGRNDTWHVHEQLCLKMGAGGIEVPYGLDRSATPEQCAQVGGRIFPMSNYMVHVWSVPGFEMTDEYGGMFGEVNPKLACADGSYYMLPLEEWADHPMNVCRVQ